jgi:hypothetical protein
MRADIEARARQNASLVMMPIGNGVGHGKALRDGTTIIDHDVRRATEAPLIIEAKASPSSIYGREAVTWDPRACFSYLNPPSAAVKAAAKAKAKAKAAAQAYMVATPEERAAYDAQIARERREMDNVD